MKVLTLDQLLELHILAVRQGGGDENIRDLGRLESAIAAQTQAVFGEELYPTIFDKAAAVTRGIIGDHAFVDGNKRTGMLCALTMLEINGYKFSAKKGEIEDFAVFIATKKPEVTEIAVWLKTHTSKK